jgi:hypothetical protein
MDGRPNRAASLEAGVVAGLVGFATFLVLHHVWIVPIWFIAPVGAVIAAAGGAAAGRAYAELLPYLPPRPWTSVAVAAVVGLILLPAVVIAELRGPIYAVGTGGTRSVLPCSDCAKRRRRPLRRRSSMPR